MAKWDSGRWTTRVTWAPSTKSNHLELLHDGKSVAAMELDEWLRLCEATADLLVRRQRRAQRRRPGAAPSP